MQTEKKQGFILQFSTCLMGITQRLGDNFREKSIVSLFVQCMVNRSADEQREGRDSRQKKMPEKQRIREESKETHRY